MMAGTAWRWGFWFRIRGYGLNIHVRPGEHDHLYSQRDAWHHLGPLCWRPLHPREVA